MGGGVLVAVPPGLVAVPVPPLSGEVPGPQHAFVDAAPAALEFFVQSGPPLSSRLPASSEQATAEFARGFAASLPGAHDVRPLAYDAQRGAVAVELKLQRGAPGGTTDELSAVAMTFVTRTATVLAVAAAPATRAADVRAAAMHVWQHSTVAPELRLPVESPSFDVGRWLGVVVGSVLGEFAVAALSLWILRTAGVDVRVAVSIPGVLLAALGALAFAVSRGSAESLLQLACYLGVGGCIYGPPGRWLARRVRGRARLAADERGLSTVEYVIILVLLAAIAIVAWRSFGAAVRTALGRSESTIDATLISALAEAESGSGSPASSGAAALTAAGPSGVATAGSARPASSSQAALASESESESARGASGSVPPPAARRASASPAPPAARPASASPTPTAAPSSPPPAVAASPPPAVAATAAPSEPRGWVDRARDYVAESAPAQTLLGVATGTIQSVLPGGFLLPTPLRDSRSFEMGRAAGQFATGVVQILSGGAMTLGGGTAAVGGAVAAPATAGGSLILTGAGASVSATGLAVAGQGMSNVLAARDTLTRAVKMSGNESSSGGPPPAANSGMLGAKGTQVTSKTMWKSKAGGKAGRIDVENPNPGQRPGQIHYQQGDEKYLYDPATKTFPGAPKSVNDKLKDPEIQAAIAKAMKVLGE